MNKLLLTVAPLTFKALIYAIMLTCRVKRIGSHHVETLKAQGRQWIYSAWHNNTATAVWMERNQGLAMMASDSSDGELIAGAISALGNLPIRGSSSAAGDRAVRDMVRALRNGRSSALTPDGPRGPKYRLQPGVLWIAALSGCALLPYHIEADRQWEFSKSWDGHKIPKPFSTVYVCIGEPFEVSRAAMKSESEHLRDEFEKRMLDNAEHCSRMAGGLS